MVRKAACCVALGLTAALAGCGGAKHAAKPSPTATVRPTAPATSTAAATATPTPAATPTASGAPTGSATPTQSPSPVASSTPTTSTGTIKQTMLGFGAAIERGDGQAAVAYFTPSLAAQAATTSPLAMLGISTSPVRYHFTITSSTATAGTVKLIDYFQRGHISNRLRLVKLSSGWRIAAITRI